MYFVQQCAFSNASREDTIATAVFAGALNKMTDFEVECFGIFGLQYKSPNLT